MAIQHILENSVLDNKSKSRVSSHESRVDAAHSQHATRDSKLVSPRKAMLRGAKDDRSLKPKLLPFRTKRGKGVLEDASGYTLVELTVVVSLMAVIGVTFIGIVAHYFVVISRNNALSEMTITSQNLLRSTVENIRYGDGVRQNNQIPDAHSPSGGWNTGNSNFVIIIALPALDNSRQYIIDPDTGSPYMNELVYYKSGTTLMERILANPAATSNRLKTTCPANLATSSCPADPVLANYIHSMTFTLFDQDAAQTSVATDARSIKIDLSTQRNAPGNPITVNTGIRVTLRNRF